MNTVEVERLPSATESLKIKLESQLNKINYVDKKNRKVIFCESTYKSPKNKIGSFSLYLPIDESMVNIDMELIFLFNFKINGIHGGILVNNYDENSSKTIVSEMMDLLEIDNWEDKFKISNFSLTV